MDAFEIVRYLTEAEKPTEKPIAPAPTCHGSATEAEWDEYWIKRDAYYSGLVLRKV